MKRPLLNEKQAANRLKWAKEHRNWTVDDWRRVIWSDECAVQRDSDPSQVYVFRHQNKQEKYAIKNIRGRSKGGQMSQMIWVCFCNDKLGPIVFLKDSVNADVYIDVLSTTFLPFVDAISGDGIRNTIFQQDNASPHTAKKTKEFLESTARNHGFTIIEWPSISPDMNPIENLWARLKLELHIRYPDTRHLSGAPDAVRAELSKRLAEVWWTIGEEVLNSLVESMPARVEALIAAKGWYTDY